MWNGWHSAVSSFVRYHTNSSVSNLKNLRVVNLNGTECVMFKVLVKELCFEVTLTYSWAYSAPIIYFRLFDLQKNEFLMDLERVSGLLPIMNTNGVGVYKQAISIDYHPVDAMGCFMVHPCMTSSIMSEMPNLKDEDYLISFWNLYSIIKN